MITITCAMCRKDIEDANFNVNYVGFYDKTICRPCYKQMEVNIENKMDRLPKYTYKNYMNFLKQELGRAKL